MGDAFEIFFPEVNKQWHAHATKRFAGPFVNNPYDRVDVDPIILAHAAVIQGYTIKDFYSKPILGITSVIFTNEMYDLLPVTHWFYSNVWLRELGCKLVYKETLPPVVEEPRPVKTPEDVDKLEVPDVSAIEKGPTFTEFVTAYDYVKQHFPGWFVPIHFGFCLTAMAGEIVGPERFILWTARQPRLCHKVLEVVTDTSVNGAIALAKRYGFAMMVLGGVLANSDVFSPKKVKEFGIDYHIRLVKKAFKGGAGPQLWYHLCGNHENDYMLWKNVVVTPFTVIHIGYKGKEPFPIPELVKEFGNMATVMSNVDAKLLYLGTPKQVYNASVKMILEGKNAPRGFIHGTSCEAPPPSLPANIYAMVKAAREVGKYE